MFFYFLVLGIVFYVYMFVDELILGLDYILIFWLVVINIGNYYNLYNGMFICLSYGVYGFLWIISVREYIGM